MMLSTYQQAGHSLTGLFAAADAAALAIPPAWPLAATVAVNPYLGQSGHDLAHTGALLSRVGGARVTMPRAWYRTKIAAGEITECDLSAALLSEIGPSSTLTVADLLEAVSEVSPDPVAVPTIAHLAADASGIDWPAIVAERFGAWAAAQFDAGQALWKLPGGKGAYASWKTIASHDLTPEITGLHGFCTFVADSPDTATDALVGAAARLRLPEAAVQVYFHRLLVDLGGWSHYARYRLWQARLAGDGDDTITDLLTIRLLWEQALFERYEAEIGAEWWRALDAFAEPIRPSENQRIDAVLQEAVERAGQRNLASTLSARTSPPSASPLKLQAAFCIDVRSEVFRRALESLDSSIETKGFAGFFGLAAEHHRFASDAAERRLPVLLTPVLQSRAGTDADADADRTTRYRARASRAWDRFKLAAVSSFAFVEASGPLYVEKLVRDALGLRRAALRPDPVPRLDPALDLPSRITAATSILRAMSLATNFAPLVLLVGHGAGVVNNPHASALQCGACGGYPGEVNARLLAGLLNDPAVRDGLRASGIEIPRKTIFLAALHDTTTDDVTLFEDGLHDSGHIEAIEQVRQWLAAAAVLTRNERAIRLPRAVDGGHIAARSRDWSETRPEWGLAGCKAFIAAPRARTAGVDLAGRAFLHDYDWRADDGFGVLELILTAPVVVASWISLQYYGSTVSPQLFGGGNKLLHNVVGGIGVVEGNGGLLRAGLPWQSVYDGTTLVHEPLRLTVIVEAPEEAIAAILQQHDDVRALFDNRWLHLLVMDENGVRSRYIGDLQWMPEQLIGADVHSPELVA